MKMKPEDRYQWIVNYLRGEGDGKGVVDICDCVFVEAYIEATGAKFTPTNYGAPKCPQLGRDLKEMHDSYILRRTREGLQGMAGMGFPTWVWSYRLYKAWLA